MYHWQFASRNERPQSWYIVALIVVVFLVIYGIVQWLYMMSIVAFLFAGVYIMKENNSAPLIDVDITDIGIQVQDTFYEYSQISSFAILYDQQVAKMLRFSVKKWIATLIDIPLTQEVNPAELRSILLENIPENPDAEFTRSDRMIQAMRL